jgi:putative oxidoreductase
MSDHFIERFGPLAGRVLIGGVYVVNGIGLFGAFNAVAGLMAVKGVPAPEALLATTIAAWLVFGAFVVVGYRVRVAGLVLAAITVPVTFCIHAPWGADPSAFQNELNHFLKNLAIIGGLLYVAASRPGAFSLQAAGDAMPLALPARPQR